MSNLLVPQLQNWFHKLSMIASYNESELENSFLQHSNSVFPGYLICKFNFSFTSEFYENAKRPDILMVHSEYKEWWLVEVETSKDNLNHVESQVAVFSKPNYNLEKLVTFSERKFNEINISVDTNKLRELFSSKEPNVLVIVDEIKSDWTKRLKKYSMICEFQIYKNSNGDSAYHLSGEYPIIYETETFIKSESYPNLYKLSDNIFGTTENQIYITFNNLESKWKIFSKNNKTYIQFLGKENPLSQTSKYVIKKDLNGKFYFHIY